MLEGIMQQIWAETGSFMGRLVICLLLLYCQLFSSDIFLVSRQKQGWKNLFWTNWRPAGIEFNTTLSFISKQPRTMQVFSPRLLQSREHIKGFLLWSRKSRIKKCLRI